MTEAQQDDDYPYDNVQLGKPPLRQWDLDNNSTWFDRSHAAPSDEFLEHTWLIWSILFYLFSGFNLLVLLGVLLSQQARSKIFNQYLIYLMIPDVFLTGLCAFWCAFLTANGGYMHPAFCKIQSFYIVSGIAANSWLNGLVAYEIHKLLTYSLKRLRYFPPTSKSLAGKAVAIYLFSFFLAVMGIFDDEWSPWLPHKINVQNGFVCLPVPYNQTSNIFFFAIFYPLLNGLPLAYSIWATYDIVRKKKLPPRGKKREVAVYFFRICLVFLMMWLPGLLFLFVLGSVSPWYVVISGIWAHGQGAVSAGVMMMKSDIYQAFINLVRCRCFHEDSMKSGSVGELQVRPPNVEGENAGNESTRGGGDDEEDESKDDNAMIERLFGTFSSSRKSFRNVMSGKETSKRRMDSKIDNGSEHATSEGSPFDSYAIEEDPL